MYAVIETGGKQYRVELGTELAVERLDAEPGSSITLDRVLLVADGEEAAIGRPLVADAAVAADVVAQDRADKVIVFKYRPKARSRVKKGHRQERTVLRVSDIRFNGRSAAEDAERARIEAKTERERLEEAAARQAAEDAALAARLAERSAPSPAAPTKGRGRKMTTEPKPADATTATTEPAATAPKAPRASRAKSASTADAGAPDIETPAQGATSEAAAEAGAPEASGPEGTATSATVTPGESATATPTESEATTTAADDTTSSPAETEKDQ